VILTDGETRSDVPSECMPLAAIKRYTEAAFTVSVPREIGTEIHKSPVEIPACCDVYRFGYRQKTPPRDFHPEVVTGLAVALYRSFPRYYPNPFGSFGLHRYEPAFSQNRSCEGQG